MKRFAIVEYLKTQYAVVDRAGGGSLVLKNLRIDARLLMNTASRYPLRTTEFIEDDNKLLTKVARKYGVSENQLKIYYNFDTPEELQSMLNIILVSRELNK